MIAINIKGSQGFKELPKNIPCDIAHIWDGAGQKKDNNIEQ